MVQATSVCVDSLKQLDGMPHEMKPYCLTTKNPLTSLTDLDLISSQKLVYAMFMEFFTYQLSG